MSIEVLPVSGVPEVREGDDLASVLTDALGPLGPRDGDIVVVTQKVVSKAEGRVVPGDRASWVESETRRVVARRGDLVIAETRHGFVCAHSGVDASNVAEGFVSLLPEDPDASAERLRAAFSEATGARLAVVISDTFGRAWRAGVVNVAVGCAGLPTLVDLRGTPDRNGRMLEATVVALADEVAAASGLVMGKADGVPAAVVRGLRTDSPPGSAAELVRPAEEDLFRESPLCSISARRTIRSFGAGEVSREKVEEAIRAACTAPSPHDSRPWLFAVLDSPPSQRLLLGALAAAWKEDLRADGVDEAVIEEQLARSQSVLGAAPCLIVPFVGYPRARDYPDEERAEAEREMYLLSAGAAVENLLLALSAQGLASAWLSSTIFSKEETREALGIGRDWSPMGTVTVGPPPEDPPAPRRPFDLSDHLAQPPED